MPSEYEELLPIGETARAFGVSVDTIRRWEKAGKITGSRTATGFRRYSRSEINRLLHQDVA
jgi:DNA-binding transcriptional MerR regulator